LQACRNGNSNTEERDRQKQVCPYARVFRSALFFLELRLNALLALEEKLGRAFQRVVIQILLL